MSNAVAELGTTVFTANIGDKDIKEKLLHLLEIDGDLTTNEEYFSEDTLKLGFESEADRIVKTHLEVMGTIDTKEDYKNLIERVWSHIEQQEYFGNTRLEFEDIDDARFVVVAVYGGNYDY